MCGISGCVVNKKAMNLVINALIRLQNRGYDSAGVCTVVDNAFVYKKSVSDNNGNAVDTIVNHSVAKQECNAAVGHTRWATHGGKSEANAHPHHTDDLSMMLVHNGIIENYVSLRQQLDNYHFYGQTDTEIAVKYLHSIYQGDMMQSLEQLNNTLQGSWAILIMIPSEPHRIYYLKNGSPLLIGRGESAAMFVSELNGFDTSITEYTSIEDGDYGYLDTDLVSTKTYHFHSIPDRETVTCPDPFPHWTLREIHDQPAAINSLIKERIVDNDYFFPELDSFDFDPVTAGVPSPLWRVDHVIFLACGTSLHAAHIGADYFRKMNVGCTINVIDGADFEETDVPHNRTVMFLLSQSGETKDLYRALELGRTRGIKSIGIVNVENSLIARDVDACLYLRAGREHAVASTKSFTNQVIMLIMVAGYLSGNSSHVQDILALPDEYSRIIYQAEKHIETVLPLFNSSSAFVLGKQAGEWIAREAALKIKEISYIHAEGFSAAALKHGPFALLTTGVPVIILSNRDKYISKIENVIQEVSSRDASVILVTNVPESRAAHTFYFNTNNSLFPLISVVYFQILAYRLALIKGNNPDYPRNLAKVVTVE